jgi:hypothetical protein
MNGGVSNRNYGSTTSAEPIEGHTNSVTTKPPTDFTR